MYTRISPLQHARAAMSRMSSRSAAGSFHSMTPNMARSTSRCALVNNVEQIDNYQIQQKRLHSITAVSRRHAQRMSGRALFSSFPPHTVVNMVR